MRLVLTAAIIIIATATVQQGNVTFSTTARQDDDIACALPRAFPGMHVSCAMSPQHSDDGDTCGRCVLIRSGYPMDTLVTTKLSPLVVFVNRVCLSCNPGDLVLTMEGSGQWRVQWTFVSCRDARQNLSSTPALRGGLS